MRKILIGFISLGGVLAAYLLYTGVSDSPIIEDDPAVELIGSPADSNAEDFDSNVGKIGEIGLGTTEVAKFVTRNERTRQIEQISGYKRLLSKAKGLWQVEEPYVNVYEPEFTCYITADSGLVQMENAADRMTPKDATFTGNVVIHISPRESSTLKESFVYLDDIVILGERSEISTKGPVRYVSDDVSMRGKGLEVIYNDQANRIEFFRIVDLEELRIRNYRTAMFATDQPPVDKPDEFVARTEAEQTDETIVVAGPDETAKAAVEPVAVPDPNTGVYYKCILSKNVLIDTPNELIFADQRIHISDIFWSRDSIASEPNDANEAEAVAVAGQADADAETNGVAAGAAADPNVAVVAAAEPNVPPPAGPNDVVVTCKNGLVLVPMDTRRPLDEFLQASAGSAGRPPAEFENDSERTKFFAPRIDYNRLTGDVAADGPSDLRLYVRDMAAAEANEPPALTSVTARDSVTYSPSTNHVVFKGDCQGSMPQGGLAEPRDVTFESPEITVELTEDKSVRPDVVARGPAKLTFYVQDTNDPNAADVGAEPIPVTVTAQKLVRFSAAANQIDFEDDCRCETVREDPNGVTKYTLLSQRIAVKLVEDSNDRSSDLTGGIEHLAASGGVVRLATTRTGKSDPNLIEYVGDGNDTELLGGVEVKCSLVEYDPGLGLFKASGPPAEIQMDNSKVAFSGRDPNGFSLREPCYAFLANFDSLKYFTNENRIVAEAAPGGALWLHYVPVVDGVHDLDSITTASAARVEAFLVETPDGRTELSTLSATGGIDVNDLSNGNHFLGSDLYYDHKTAIMKVTGDESSPCLCNGAVVDEIEYNVTTGDLTFDVVGPGPMQTNQQ